MEALSSIYRLHLDDAALSPPCRIDGMYAKPAITDEPRHHQLGHDFYFLGLDFPSAFLMRPSMPELRCSGDRGVIFIGGLSDQAFKKAGRAALRSGRANGGCVSTVGRPKEQPARPLWLGGHAKGIESDAEFPVMCSLRDPKSDANDRQRSAADRAGLLVLIKRRNCLMIQYPLQGR